MTLNSLRNISFDTSSGMDQAWWAHWQDHVEIVQAINKQKNISLQEYQIYPFNKNSIDDILFKHQLYHSDMNGVFNYDGQDLLNINFKDKESVKAWIYQNFKEHRDIRAALLI